MELILWRHCDAAPGVPDELRPLTPLGVAQAGRMAGWLGRRLPAACRILVSPAVRAQQTAQALARSFETVPDIGTGASVATVLDAAGWPRAQAPVLVVGHQPTLGNVAAFLLSGAKADPVLRPGAVWWLANDPSRDESSVVLQVAISPDFV